MTHLTQSLSFVTDYAYRISTWVYELIEEYKKARAVTETMNELNRLSDAELRDIGITRGEIHDIAIQTHYGSR